MKRIYISRDNRMMLLVTLYFLLLEVRTVLFCAMLNLEFAKRGSGLRADGFIVFLMIVLLVLFILLIKKTTEVITLRDDNFTIGLTGFQTARFELVESIEVTDKIRLSFKDGSRSAKIKVISLDRNEAKYRQFFDTVSQRASIEFDTDDAIETLKSQNNNELDKAGQEPIAFGGWLLVLVVFLVYGVISGCVSIFQYSAQRLPNQIQVTSMAMVFVLGLGMLFLIFKKHKEAVRAIIIYEWFVVVAGFVNDVYTMVIMKRPTPFITIATAGVGLAFGLVIVFSIMRYLEMSDRVKRTFVNDQLFRRQVGEISKGNGKDTIKVFLIVLASFVALCIIVFIIFTISVFI